MRYLFPTFQLKYDKRINFYDLKGWVTMDNKIKYYYYYYYFAI